VGENGGHSAREREAHLIAVKAGNRLAGSEGPEAIITSLKLPKFNNATSWAIFRRRFETAELKNNWTQNEKAAHF